MESSGGTFARKGKKMLLDLPFLGGHWGREVSTNHPFPYMFYYQGTASGRDAMAAALAYDLLIGEYKTENGYEDGFTPIEDIRVRDSLAQYAKNTLQFITENASQFMPSGDCHWGAAAELGTAAVALTMPAYDTEYYGTSGAPPDNLQATHLWAPYPNHPNTWWDVATNEYPATLYQNPDQSEYSRISSWLLSKDATHTPDPDFFTWYYPGNVGPLYWLFSGMIHNLGLTYDFSAEEQKFYWYLNHANCADENCSVNFRFVNKFYSFALNALGKIRARVSANDYNWWIAHGTGAIGGISFFDDTLELCTNGLKDGYEDGIDCGGTCPSSC